jgi:hypothetical protein
LKRKWNTARYWFLLFRLESRWGAEMNWTIAREVDRRLVDPSRRDNDPAHLRGTISIFLIDRAYLDFTRQDPVGLAKIA